MACCRVLGGIGFYRLAVMASGHSIRGLQERLTGGNFARSVLVDKACPRKEGSQASTGTGETGRVWGPAVSMRAPSAAARVEPIKTPILAIADSGPCGKAWSAIRSDTVSPTPQRHAPPMKPR